MDDYIDYISFKDGKQYTILNSSVSIHETFELDPSENKTSTDIVVQPNTHILPLVDSSADEFNSSMLAYNTKTNTWSYTFTSDCTLFIVYRRQLPKGISSLWIGELDLLNNRILNAQPLLTSPFTHYEDPRMFVFRGELYVSYSRWGNEEIQDYNDPRSIIQIAFTHVKRLSTTFELGKTYVPPYGKNMEPGKMEKNWGFFEYQKELHCLYGVNPLTIFKYDMESNTCRFVRTEKMSSTICIRGGTPPIFINGSFVSFIHCSDYLVYMVKLGVTDKVFKIKEISDFPILSSISKILKGKESMNQNGILFPCGAVYDSNKKQYIISMGYKDKVNVISYVKA